MRKNHFLRFVFNLFIFLCWVAIFICVGAYVFLTTTWGGRVAATYLIKLYIPSCNVQVGSYRGTIEKELWLKNVTITNIPTIKDASVHIQDLYVQVPLTHWDHISFKVIDSRLLFPTSDPIIFNGNMVQNYVNGNSYAHSVDVHQIVSALGYDDLAKYLYGFLSHIDFTLDGPVGALHLKGHLFVDKIIFKDTIVKDGFGRFDLTITALGAKPSMNGFVMLDSAAVKTNRINIDLTTSKVDFNGDVSDFLLDIHGSSKVEDIIIDMAIKGTFQRPKLTFNSDPPMPEDQIIMTLVTGKGWSEIDNARSQGFGLRKKLTEAFNVGMELEEMPTQLGREKALGYARTIEGQVNVTDSLSVNVARKFYSAESTAATTPSAQPGTDNDTEFYLQYKQRF